MFESPIMLFFFILCVFYLFHKLLNIDASSRSQILMIVSSIIISACIYFVTQYVYVLDIIFIIAASVLVTKLIFHKNIKLTFITITISYGISYFLHIVTLPLIGVVAYLFELMNMKLLLREILSTALSGILQILLASIPFRFKRFRKGMPYLHKEEFFNFGTAVGAITVLSTVLLNIFRESTIIDTIIFCTYITLGILLLIWWRNYLHTEYNALRFTHDYNSLESELEQLMLLNNAQKADIEKLSSIVHRDNKLIPAMAMSVTTLLNDSANGQSVSPDLCHKMLNELDTMIADRKGILPSAQSFTGFSTQEPRTDAIINYFEGKALNQKVELILDIEHTYCENYSDFISSKDICTILADLLENALNATIDTINPKVRLFIGITPKKELIIQVYDNGPFFDKKVLQHMGIKRIITHAHTGGSGIGYITIHELVNKYNGHYHVNENINDADYTKYIEVVFNTPIPQ